MTLPWYTDAEIDDLCDGYVTNAAKVRHLRSLGLTVKQKPNGRPLVIRAQAELVLAGMQQIDQQNAKPMGARPNKEAMVLMFSGRSK